MNLKEIYGLIDKAEQSSFHKIKIKVGDVEMTLSRGAAAAPVEMAAAQQQTIRNDKTQQNNEYNEEDYVKAPISGVFYAAKEPGAEPFVTIGQKVKKGDTLCIIEAMKTMNEIAAPKSGVIERVLKSDSDPVTAGDTLFQYVEEK